VLVGVAPAEIVTAANSGRRSTLAIFTFMMTPVFGCNVEIGRIDPAFAKRYSPHVQ
jgi:hypothetical protein